MKKAIRKVETKRIGRKERKERMKILNANHKSLKSEKKHEDIRIPSKEKRQIQAEIRKTKIIQG